MLLEARLDQGGTHAGAEDMSLPTSKAASHRRWFGVVGEALAVVAAAAAEVHGCRHLGQRSRAEAVEPYHVPTRRFSLNTATRTRVRSTTGYWPSPQERVLYRALGQACLAYI
jgi:hypothetical protein